MKRLHLLGISTLFLLISVSFVRGQDTAQPCPCGIENPVTLDKIKHVVECCQIGTVEALLQKLPKEFRSRYVLVYSSRSRQGADPLYPRVIMFGLDAKTIIAFNGAPHQKFYASIEILQFNDATKTFLPAHEVLFPSEFSRHHPAVAPDFRTIKFLNTPAPACTGCHREEARPNWDPYDAWPGVYGSNDDTMPKVEAAAFSVFERDILFKFGRYRYLEKATHYPDNTGLRDYYRNHNRPNIQFTWLLSRLNAQANARAINNNDDLMPFRYAILAAVSCDMDFSQECQLDQLIPKIIRHDFARSYKEIADETQRRIKTSIAGRKARQCEGLKALNNNVSVSQTECNFRTAEWGYTGPTSRLRYILENRGICFDLQRGSMEFRHENFGFFAGPNRNVGGLDLYLWKEPRLLVTPRDQDLIDIYERAWNNRTKEGELRFKNEKETLCERLKERSRLELEKTFFTVFR
jgi:hypothetical protein